MKRWLPLTVFCLGAAIVGASAALVVPTRQVVQASHRPQPSSRRLLVRATHLPTTEQGEPVPTAADTTGARYRGGMTISGTTRSGAVLFTFDDGPSLRTTPAMLDELDARDVKAIFFIVGERIAGDSHRARQRRALVAEIAARGHMVGNHTYSHKQLTLLSDAEIREEILRTERLLADILGERPWLFRPPGGARSERVDMLIAELGYTAVLWNMDTRDTSLASAEETFASWESTARTPAAMDGGIVLLHDLLPWSVSSFKQIHDRVVEMGSKPSPNVPWTVVADLEAFFVPRADAPASQVAPSLAAL